MNLTNQDIANANKLCELLHAHNNAAAVSDALSVAVDIASMIDEGREILVRNQQGDIERITIDGLD